MEALIVTGASRGLGAQLLGESVSRYGLRIGLARSETYDAVAEAAANSRIRVDCAHRSEIEAAASSLVFGLEYQADLTGVTFIHNAGTLDPLTSILQSSSVAFEESLGTNLLAPMILSAKIGALAKAKGVPCTMVFISSGAAQHSYAGWSAYCSSKAGLEMFARCLAVEEPTIQVLIVNPGVMDTPMQEQIRTAEESDFPEVHRFRAFKDQGSLASPQSVAKKILDLLRTPTWSSGTLVDIRSV